MRLPNKMKWNEIKYVKGLDSLTSSFHVDTKWCNGLVSNISDSLNFCSAERVVCWASRSTIQANIRRCSSCLPSPYHHLKIWQRRESIFRDKFSVWNAPCGQRRDKCDKVIGWNGNEAFKSVARLIWRKCFGLKNEWTWHLALQFSGINGYPCPWEFFLSLWACFCQLLIFMAKAGVPIAEDTWNSSTLKSNLLTVLCWMGNLCARSCWNNPSCRRTSARNSWV